MGECGRGRKTKCIQEGGGTKPILPSSSIGQYVLKGKKFRSRRLAAGTPWKARLDKTPPRSMMMFPKEEP